VQQPWAAALVSGLKDVENRGVGIDAALLPEIILVLASKPLPTAAHMGEYRARGGTETIFATQALVGAIEITRTATEFASIWKDAGSVGWIVGKSVRFPHPVENIRGSQTPRLKLANHVDRVRIETELGF